MLINELKASQVKSLMLGPEFETWLDKNEFELIGEGLFSKVYANKNSKLVIKKPDVQEKCYHLFAEYAQANYRKNPYLPKIKIIEPKGYNVRIYIIERLESLESDFERAEMFQNMFGFFMYWLRRDRKSLRKQFADKFKNETKSLEEYIKYLKDIIAMNRILFKLKQKGCRYDLHPGNVMLRGDQLVITDPFVDKK